MSKRQPKNRNWQRLSATVLLAVVLLFTSACNLGNSKGLKTSEQNQTAAVPPILTTAKSNIWQNDTVHIAFFLDESLNPLQKHSQLNKAMLSLCYEPLFAVNGDNRLQNVLAASLAFTADHKTYVVKLKDRKFHNGSKITCQDAAKSLTYYFQYNYGTTPKILAKNEKFTGKMQTFTEDSLSYFKEKDWGIADTIINGSPEEYFLSMPDAAGKDMSPEQKQSRSFGLSAKNTTINIFSTIEQKRIANINSITVYSDCLALTLKTPDVLLPLFLAVPVIPAAEVEAQGLEAPTGSGAYKISQVENKAEIYMTYAGERSDPTVKNIYCLGFDDLSEARAAVTKREIDLLPIFNDTVALPTTNFEKLQTTSDIGIYALSFVDPDLRAKFSNCLHDLNRLKWRDYSLCFDKILPASDFRYVDTVDSELPGEGKDVANPTQGATQAMTLTLPEIYTITKTKDPVKLDKKNIVQFAYKTGQTLKLLAVENTLSEIMQAHLREAALYLGFDLSCEFVKSQDFWQRQHQGTFDLVFWQQSSGSNIQLLELLELWSSLGFFNFAGMDAGLKSALVKSQASLYIPGLGQRQEPEFARSMETLTKLLSSALILPLQFEKAGIIYGTHVLNALSANNTQVYKGMEDLVICQP